MTLPDDTAPDPAATATPGPEFNDWVRAVVIIATLGGVAFLAIFGPKEVALVCAGALVATLNQSSGFLLRAKVLPPVAPTTPLR